MLANATRYGVFRKRAEQRSMSSYNQLCPSSRPLPSVAPTFTTSSLFLFSSSFTSMHHLYHQPPPCYHPPSTTRPFFYFSLSFPFSSLLIPYPTTFASLTLSSVPSSLSLSLSLSFSLSLSLFLCSSLNYWKQNGLKTKTQADVA